MTARLAGEGRAPEASPAPGPVIGPPTSLYIHVPFCLSLCPYCDFVVVVGAAARGPRNRIDAFVEALDSELRLRADELDARWGAARPPLETLYLGGGTPTLLPAAAIDSLLATVRDRYGLASEAEVTIEANPGPAERGDPSHLAAARVTRLSIGAQSFDPAELRSIGRRHRPEDVAATVTAARNAGIRSISLDLLYDIPGGTLATWASTLDASLALEPEHLSLYALTLDDPEAEGLTGPAGDHLPTTRGARRWRDRARRSQDDDRAAAMYELADRRLAAAGYAWYEISNWARLGHESRHNQVYWQRAPYEAVGPGAHAFDGETRRWNAARLDGYLAALIPEPGRRPALPPGGSEHIEPAGADAERTILGLRTASGIAASEAAAPALAEHLGWARAARLVELTAGDRFVLTTRGRLLSNELFARLV
ncbi:MAG TPA: coproporphyrinogen-III oxidase family protein [Candidatus Limnocylindrales bacterium]|nr:coproporphyrinogen-III oxidase family protein [Candidatus Limnocylindrales bacterium]